MACVWLIRKQHPFELPKMLPNANWTITNFALLIAEPRSGLPTPIWIALSVVCVVAVGWALRNEGTRQTARRPAAQR